MTELGVKPWDMDLFRPHELHGLLDWVDAENSRRRTAK